MIGSDHVRPDSLSLFAQYRYRATIDVETKVSLFDADLKNASAVLEAGVRFMF